MKSSIWIYFVCLYFAIFLKTVLCFSECKPDEFSCEDDRCVANSRTCDGFRDCADGSDEDPFLCDAPDCPENMFPCKTSGNCIARGLVCNRVNDCPDRSDEKACEHCSKPDVRNGTTRYLNNRKIKTQYVINGRTIRIVCDKGYGLSTTETNKIMCNEGEWIPSAPLCKPTRCSKPHINFGGIRYLNNRKVMGSNVKVGRKVKVRCARGWYPDRESVIGCFGGNWRPAIPQCIQATCELPNVPNGDIEYIHDSGAGEPMEMTQVVCHEGYTLGDNDRLVCSNGRWVGDTPTCTETRITEENIQIAGCLRPNVINLGEIFSDVSAEDQREIFARDTVLHLSCKFLYTLLGNATVHCADGIWLPELPTCVLLATTRYREIPNTATNTWTKDIYTAPDVTETFSDIDKVTETIVIGTTDRSRSESHVTENIHTASSIEHAIYSTNNADDAGNNTQTLYTTHVKDQSTQATGKPGFNDTTSSSIRNGKASGEYMQMSSDLAASTLRVLTPTNIQVTSGTFKTTIMETLARGTDKYLNFTDEVIYNITDRNRATTSHVTAGSKLTSDMRIMKDPAISPTRTPQDLVSETARISTISEHLETTVISEQDRSTRSQIRDLQTKRTSEHHERGHTKREVTYIGKLFTTPVPTTQQEAEDRFNQSTQATGKHGFNDTTSSSIRNGKASGEYMQVTRDLAASTLTVLTPPNIQVTSGTFKTTLMETLVRGTDKYLNFTDEVIYDITDRNRATASHVTAGSKLTSDMRIMKDPAISPTRTRQDLVSETARISTISEHLETTVISEQDRSTRSQITDLQTKRTSEHHERSHTKTAVTNIGSMFTTPVPTTQQEAEDRFKSCHRPTVKWGSLNYLNNTPASSPLILHDTTIQLACNQGYVIQGTTTETRLLVKCYDSRWLGLFPECVPAPCRLPNVQMYSTGTIRITHSNHGTSFSVACSDGYIVVGTKMSTCMFGKWMPSLGSCEKAQVLRTCDRPPLSDVTMTPDKLQYVPGDHLTITCYSGNGGVNQFQFPVYQSITCLSSGYWSGTVECAEELPACTPGQPEFQLIHGSKIIGNNIKVMRVRNYSQCERLCRDELSFLCLSADYDHQVNKRSTCMLSDVNRRILPEKFVKTRRTIVHLDRLCASSEMLSRSRLTSKSTTEDPNTIYRLSVRIGQCFGFREYTYTGNQQLRQPYRQFALYFGPTRDPIRHCADICNHRIACGSFDVVTYEGRLFYCYTSSKNSNDIDIVDRSIYSHHFSKNC